MLLCQVLGKLCTKQTEEESLFTMDNLISLALGTERKKIVFKLEILSSFQITCPSGFLDAFLLLCT
jgi:hypothetical protein